MYFLRVPRVSKVAARANTFPQKWPFAHFQVTLTEMSWFGKVWRWCVCWKGLTLGQLVTLPSLRMARSFLAGKRTVQLSYLGETCKYCYCLEKFFFLICNLIVRLTTYWVLELQFLRNMVLSDAYFLNQSVVHQTEMNKMSNCTGRWSGQPTIASSL